MGPLNFQSSLEDLRVPESDVESQGDLMGNVVDILRICSHGSLETCVPVKTEVF